MQFYQDEKPPLVWDPKAGRVTVTFIDGVFEAEGDRVELLKAAGYRFDVPVPVKPSEPELIKEDPPLALRCKSPKVGRARK